MEEKTSETFAFSIKITKITTKTRKHEKLQITLTTNKILPQRHQDSKHSKKKFIYNSW